MGWNCFISFDTASEMKINIRVLHLADGGVVPSELSELLVPLDGGSAWNNQL